MVSAEQTQEEIRSREKDKQIEEQKAQDVVVDRKPIQDDIEVKLEPEPRHISNAGPEKNVEEGMLPKNEIANGDSKRKSRESVPKKDKKEKKEKNKKDKKEKVYLLDSIEPQIKHPIFIEIERLQNEIDVINKLETPEQVKQYTLENVLIIQKPDVYRSKIKGFHKAFNVKEKIVYDNELNNQFNTDKTGNKSAIQLLQNAEQLRAKRLKNTEIKEQIKIDKTKQQRQ